LKYITAAEGAPAETEEDACPKASCETSKVITAVKNFDITQSLVPPEKLA
jgi:hypothetical protein